MSTTSDAFVSDLDGDVGASPGQHVDIFLDPQNLDAIHLDDFRPFGAERGDCRRLLRHRGQSGARSGDQRYSDFSSRGSPDYCFAVLCCFGMSAIIFLKLELVFGINCLFAALHVASNGSL